MHTGLARRSSISITLLYIIIQSPLLLAADPHSLRCEHLLSRSLANSAAERSYIEASGIYALALQMFSSPHPLSLSRGLEAASLRAFGLALLSKDELAHLQVRTRPPSSHSTRPPLMAISLHSGLGDIFAQTLPTVYSDQGLYIWPHLKARSSESSPVISNSTSSEFEWWLVGYPIGGFFDRQGRNGPRTYFSFELTQQGSLRLVLGIDVQCGQSHLYTRKTNLEIVSVSPEYKLCRVPVLQALSRFRPVISPSRSPYSKSNSKVPQSLPY